MVPLALTSAAKVSGQPLLEHVRAPDNQIVAVPHENWVHGGYARASDQHGNNATGRYATRPPRTAKDGENGRATRGTERDEPCLEGVPRKRLDDFVEWATVASRMEEAQKQLDEAQAYLAGQRLGVDSKAPASHKRQVDMQKMGKRTKRRL